MKKYTSPLGLMLASVCILLSTPIFFTNSSITNENSLSRTYNSESTESNFIDIRNVESNTSPGIASIHTAGISGIHSSISPAYNATYAIIKRGNIIGTAVLLENGYLITAGHVVDDNNNQQLEDHEKNVTIHSFVTNEATQCHVVAFGNVTNPEADYLDIAVLHPRDTLRSNVRLDAQDKPLGLPAFTIGMTGGSPPSITDGRINFPLNDTFGRTSVPIYGGNSGGGLFSDNQTCIGVVTGVAIEQRVHMLGEHAFRTRTPIYHMALYIPAKHIQPIIDHVIEREIEILRAYYLIRLLDEIHRRMGR
jgi:S1-C subfamily serine protease